jgi:hypothetical protein
MGAFRKSFAGVAALLFGIAGSASAITINYDLDTGTFSQPPGAVLEQYSSTAMAFVPQSTSAPVQLIVNFVDVQTGGPQLLQLRNFGQVSPYPTTFGAIDPANINGHVFGPSMILSSGGATSGSASVTVTPKNDFGPRGPVASTFGAGSANCSGSTCVFGVIFPDLIDVNGLLEFSGLAFDISFSGVASPFAVDSLAFNVISPTQSPQGQTGDGISVLQLPAPAVSEPSSIALLGIALVAFGMARRHRQG